ncbi:MAG: DUF72 domain-containing protein [Actinobacteria bacterium]|nr:DUF72 domain-containing protein [Actinomycetota bacterium]
MPVLIGTSGWQYKDWRERFYPKQVPQRAWLEYYAERFKLVEINNTFYMLPKPATFDSWRTRTPDDFSFVVKANRYITHIRRLRNAEDSIDRFMANARHLGEKLGPILVQLPPNLQIDVGALEACLRRFEGMRVSVEFRHDSWYTKETRAVLEKHTAALTLADRGSRPITPTWRTADWTYLRFHHGLASPIPCYGERALRHWVDELAANWTADEPVYVFFNNDPGCCAVRDSVRFAELARKAGLSTTRVPQESVHVGAFA